MSSSNARRQANEWLKTIDVNCNDVLDAGGSAWPITKNQRTKSWNVKNCKIVDVNSDADYIEDLNYPTKIQEQFDVIFCLETMQYIFNPVQCLQNFNKLLRSSGLLYLSFPFFYPHHEDGKKDYLRYTKVGMAKILEETGFKVLEIVPRIAADKDSLRKFCEAESKVNLSPNEIGYFIKAIKNN